MPLSSACLNIFVSNFKHSASPLRNVGTASFLKMARLEEDVGRLSAELLPSDRRRIETCVVRGLGATKITAARAAGMMESNLSTHKQTFVHFSSSLDHEKSSIVPHHSENAEQFNELQKTISHYPAILPKHGFLLCVFVEQTQ